MRLQPNKRVARSVWGAIALAAQAGSLALAQPVSIGVVDFPLGEDAFPINAVMIQGTLPVFGPDCLIGHELNCVAYGATEDDTIRVDFPVPILNGPGAEVFVGQAFGPEPINRINHADISVDNVFFVRSEATDFAFVKRWPGDNANVVGWVDLNFNGFFEHDERYQLKSVTVDLTDLGVPAGGAVSSIYLRGYAMSTISDFETDFVVVGNLNQTAPCAADLTGSSDPNNPAYGVPDGLADANDFFYYLDRFAAGDLGKADLTGSADPNSPVYGVPDGTLDANDFFFYLALFAQGC